MDLIIKYDPKTDILAMKLREGAIKDEKLLDSDMVLGAAYHHDLHLLTSAIQDS